MSEHERTGDESGDERDGPGGVVRSRRELLATVGLAGAGALAGCGGLSSQSFEATPVVLDTPGQRVFGVPEFDLTESTETRSIPGGGEATLTGYLALHSRPAEDDPPVRFGTRDPRFRRVGALSTPSPEVIGAQVNPFASRPFGELLAGERGRELVRRTGILEGDSFDWRSAPTQTGSREVEVLGTTTEAKRFMGVAVGESGQPSTLVMNLARVVGDGDAVILGEFLRRLTPDGPLDPPGGVGCAGEFCQLIDPVAVDMWERYREGIGSMIRCTEIAGPGGRGTIEVCGGGGSTEDVPEPYFTIENARLVQHVEETRVQAPGSSPTYSESDPDLVEGENTAVVFEFDEMEHIDELPGPLEIEVAQGSYGQGPSPWRETFEFTKSDLRDIEGGTHTTAVLHRNANDGNGDNDNPVFECRSNPEVIIDAANVYTTDIWTRLIPGPSRVTEVPTLTVGFVALQDEDGGSRYGNGNGRPNNIRRSYESASECLRRSYPGDVVTYGHLNHVVTGRDEVSGLFKQNCDDSCVVFRDMKRVDNQLNRMATDSSYPPRGSGFPNGGVLHTDGLNRSQVVSDIRSSGFDVVVAIVPETASGGASDYYDFHNIGASGLAFGDPAAAVSVLGASASGGDVGISATTAQEVGHYFQQDYRSPSGHPMAQRRNDSDENNQPQVNGKPIDPAHARNQGSSRVNGGDAPGVLSTAYDLEDGFANLQQYRNPDGSFSTRGPSTSATSVDGVPSYMSYTGRDWEAWGDARIHQQLIDSGWNPPGTSGGGSATFVLSATGGEAEDGIRFDDVAANTGPSRYTDFDDGAVLVELVGPDGSTLESARVPANVQASHHGDQHVGGPTSAMAFALPFPERGVRVRTTHESGETEMNPVDRCVRDAVGRVPGAGFEGSAADARASVGAALDDVAAAMAEARYGVAADAMGGPVRERVRESVVGYEAALGEPTVETLLPLIDEMTDRLRGLAETG
jgi:hypothetical protein